MGNPPSSYPRALFSSHRRAFLLPQRLLASTQAKPYSSVLALPSRPLPSSHPHRRLLPTGSEATVGLSGFNEFLALAVLSSSSRLTTKQNEKWKYPTDLQSRSEEASEYSRLLQWENLSLALSIPPRAGRSPVRARRVRLPLWRGLTAVKTNDILVSRLTSFSCLGVPARRWGILPSVR